eukprot:CAMPEP_0170186972 /NCGR_PEP_ID=MMETSP0040_2-20121228/40588_1 /TAXON_ID=641309 /ORGANISM="Lotharella oceanica, Strain CCMP622" /LENGTH=270 /DNA_ID=CAMNT_0010433869 /DNA_START=96 /DNA_END=908 /DNA_ORIENTATION=+
MELVPEMMKMTLDDAYDAQRLAYPTPGHLSGAKCGATNSKGMKAFGITEPFRGLIPDGCIVQATADPDAVLDIPQSQLGGSALRGGEAEWCFRLLSEEKAKGAWEEIARAKSEVSEDAVLAIVDNVFPAVEVCGSRMVGFVETGVQLTTPMKIADGAGNGLVVLGDNRQPEGSPSLSQKIETLATRAVISKVDGDVKTEGSGLEVLSHPLKSLTWLANHFILRKEVETFLQLQGKHVMTGTCTGLDGFKVGQTFEATFEGYPGGIKIRVV